MKITKRELIEILNHSDLDYFSETCIRITAQGALKVFGGELFSSDEINQDFLKELKKRKERMQENG